MSTEDTKSDQPIDVATNLVAPPARENHSLSCECGFTVTASDLDDLIEAAKHHAERAHGMSLSADQLAAVVTPSS